MNAWLTARRVKAGHEEEFRKKWRGGDTPEGMVDSFLLEDEEDPRETLSISLWESAEKLLSYRTGDEAKKREKEMGDVVDKDRWSRGFVAWNSWDLEAAGGRKKWVAIPLLLAAAGAGVYFFLKRRGSQDDAWDDWQPEDADRTGSSAVMGDYASEPPRVGSSAHPYAPPPSVVAAPGSEPRNGGSESSMGSASGPSHPAQAFGGSSPAMAARAEPPPSSASASPHGGDAPSSVSRTQPVPTMTRQAPPTAVPTAPARSVPHAATRGTTVRDFMTANPTTVDVAEDASIAAMKMRDLNVGALPVLADGRLAGIVTDRDLALGVASRKTKPSTVAVGDVMTEAPASVSPDTSIEDAAKLMADRKIRRLPVTEGAKLVGMLALGDIAVDGEEHAAAKALVEISEPASPTT